MQLGVLKECAKDRAEFLRLGLVDLKSRAQVLQAREFGFFELLDREERFTALHGKVREILGEYSKPDLPAHLPEKIVKSVEGTCVSLDMMATAALSGEPLPMRRLAGSAVDIKASLETDGIDMWLNAVQCHHSHTYRHTMMVTAHTISFAKTLDLTEAEQILLGLGALVHDLGKVRIPLSILDKPGKLTVQERELIDKHPLFSQEILLSRDEVPKQVVDIALRHHEMLDGSGYPDGWSGNQISRRVRMITITDIYSALTEKRSYKEALSQRQALAIMFDMKGKLDSGLLKKFRKMVLSSEFGNIRRSKAQPSFA
ncbi:HD-GYP domain-containing protein [Roseibium sp. M-1]